MDSCKIAFAPLSLLVLLSAFFAPCEAVGSEVAVYLANQASHSHASFVRDLSETLATSLMQEQRLTVIDPSRTEEAVRSLGFDPSEPIAVEAAVTLGESLGVDAVVAGHFAELYGIDAELIDTQTATLLAKTTRKGRRAEVFNIVDILGKELSQNLRMLDKRRITIAVLYFENLSSEEYSLFVRGVSDMLMTSLRQSETWSVIERAQIDRGMAHFELDAGQQLSPEEASTMGSWLGADVVVIGRFTESHRVDARSVDVRKRELLSERTVTGTRREMVARVNELGGELLGSLSLFYKTSRKIAVLYFENHTSETYDRFVRGLSDMLMTSLGETEKLTIIERVQIDKAMENISLELSGLIDAKTAVEVGKWLGADAVVLGSFAKFGEAYRIDARLIDAETGELLVAQNVRGPESDVIAMVDQLGARLIDRVREKEAEFNGGTGYLRVRFMMTRAEMTERPVYHHICRLFVNGKGRGPSPVVQKAEEWVTLFSQELRAGKHDVEVIHGFVKEKNWDGEFAKQPKIFTVTIEPGETSTLQYSFGVGWFRDAYYYKHPWRGAPK